MKNLLAKDLAALLLERPDFPVWIVDADNEAFDVHRVVIDPDVPGIWLETVRNPLAEKR